MHDANLSPQIATASIHKYLQTPGTLLASDDLIAVEEPLEIRGIYWLEQKRVVKNLSITMRTPGCDYELALGFLIGEGIVQNRNEILWPTASDTHAKMQCQNLVEVAFAPELNYDFAKLERHFYATSSCGVCGKASIAAIRARKCFTSNVADDFRISADLVHALTKRLLGAQTDFAKTGGLHATGVFDEEGTLLCLREDVGRHNAFDKVIGTLFRSGRFPLERAIAVVSGRASFELVQKAAVAGIPIFIAIGAPSTLAVALAKEAGMTLIGFTRAERFNVYHGEWRVEF